MTLETCVEGAKSPQFWKASASELHWDKPYTKVFDDSHAPYVKWFCGGELNTCYNAVDRHVDQGRGDKLALIFDSAMTGTKTSFTYKDLQEEVSLVAGMMSARGLVKGDRVVIYMPMIPETVFAMLACARLGLISSLVFGGFAANELAKRIEDAKPKLVLSASCGIEPNRIVEYKPLLDAAIDMVSHKPERCIIYQRPECQAVMQPRRDIDWEMALASSKPVKCVPVGSNDPLYILYTSGTTGVPKGVVRDNGGHAAALLWSMKNVYNASRDDVFWAASDVGWVVGHSYIVYGPLLLGCTTVMYEGKPVGTPDASAFWRIIAEYNVNTLFTAPTAIRAIKGVDPSGEESIKKYDVSSLRALFLAGERADPATIKWSEETLGVPVIDHWWQTELGWPAIATCLGLGETQTTIGSAGKPVPGFNFDCLGPDSEPVAHGQSGDIVIKLPLPPGCLSTLWENDEGFVNSYLNTHKGYYLTGDAGFMDQHGYIHVMSRTDDIINVAGHRLATGAIEQIISAHKDVAECAVVGAPDDIKGEVPLGFVVLNSAINKDAKDIISEIVKNVRDTIGPVAAFKQIITVKTLPKTRSGKTLRGTIRQIVNGKDYEMPATIEDTSALEVIKAALRS